jgi:hypothetical protein
VTIKKVLTYGDLMTKCVAQYCYPDLYVPVLDKNNHVKDSYPDLYVPILDNHVKDSLTDELGALSTTFEYIAWIL